jgi:hypothetical protein
LRIIQGIGKNGFQLQNFNGGPITEEELAWASPVAFIDMGYPEKIIH